MFDKHIQLKEYETPLPIYWRYSYNLNTLLINVSGKQWLYKKMRVTSAPNPHFKWSAKRFPDTEISTSLH